MHFSGKDAITTHRGHDVWKEWDENKKHVPFPMKTRKTAYFSSITTI